MLLSWVVLSSACATSQAVGSTRSSLTENGPEWVRTSGPDVTLRGRHVVFVAGFLNELIPGYFTDNVEVTRALGAETSVLLPASGEVLEQEAQLIGREVDFRQGKPVVLFGHSKGGAAALLTVLQRPELILEGRVEAVIVLQGSIGGSPVADTLSKVPLVGSSLQSLRTDVSKQTFIDALASARNRLTDAQWKRLFSRVFYVRSAQDHTTLAAELALTKASLDGHGPNDGLVNESEMALPHGVDLGVLDADHAALTVSSFLATSTVDERRTFTRALYREVGRHVGWPPGG